METILSFGVWIKRRRKALDLTQDDLARLIGCSPETIRKIEGDARRPSRQIAELLAEHLALPSNERADFIRCARAELAVDRLPSPIRSAPRAAFVPAPLDPAQTAAPPRMNLPAQPNALIGREREIAEVCALLRDEHVRLLTLTGPGGTGKTRLALQAAAELAFRDGAWFVNLAPISDPSLVATTIAHTFGLAEVVGKPIEESLRAFLSTKRILLLLDNFEQVIDAAPSIGELLAAAPGLKVLVTSRATLHLYGEYEFAVPPLALPPMLDDRPPTTDTHSRVVGDRSSVVGQYESVRLFIARARAAKADFTVTNDNAPAVAEICQRLDGLPLAIELAATRVKLFAPEALLAHLSQPLALLVGGPRDLPARQQTLRNTIAWSYNLLDEGEQALFRRLSVFVGGCTLEATEFINDERRTMNDEVGNAPDSASSFIVHPSSLDLLASLVDKSLLRQEVGIDGEPRFVMLETVREYALERLQERGEGEEVRRRHAEYYLTLAETAEHALKGPKQRIYLDQLEQQLDNIRGAIQWELKCGVVEHAAQLATALFRFWDLRNHVSEGMGWLETVLSRADTLSQEIHAKSLALLGRFLFGRGTEAHLRAQSLFITSLEIYRALNDRKGVAYVLADLGWIMAMESTYEQATVLLNESLAIYRALEDKHGIAEVLLRLGIAAREHGFNVIAYEHLQECLALQRENGDLWGLAWALAMLGGAAIDRRDYITAYMLNNERLSVEQALNNKQGIINSLHALEQIAFAQGEYTTAYKLYSKSLAIGQQMESEQHIISIPEALGNRAFVESDYTTARIYYEEILNSYRNNNDLEGILKAYTILGVVAQREGNYAQAALFFEESLGHSRNLANQRANASALRWLARVAIDQGDITQATVLLKKSLTFYQNLDNRTPHDYVLCLLGIAALIRVDGKPEQAARFCGAALVVPDNFDMQEWSLIERTEYYRSIAAIRAQLDDATFAAAWAEGQTLTLEQAITEALAISALDTKESSV